mgnify:CR=1 FL=1
MTATTTPDSAATGYAHAIIEQAQQLLDKVAQDLNEAQAFFASYGIDPDKVLPALAPAMGAQQERELAQLIEQDRQAIEQEVSEAAARQRFSTPASSTPSAPRRPRMTI